VRSKPEKKIPGRVIEFQFGPERLRIMSATPPLIAVTSAAA
jgi:hypothetical protein